MRPATFSYVRADTVDAATAALRETEGAQPLAGGQSLINRMRARVVRPTAVVDISRLEGLSYIRAESGELRVGALTTMAELHDQAVASQCYALYEAARSVGDPLVRNRATAAGNLFNPDQVSDLAPVLLASAGRVVVHGSAGSREVDADAFLETRAPALDAGELVTELRFGRGGASSAYEKLTRRRADAAVASAAVFVSTEGGEITDLGVAFSAVHEHPIRARAVERALLGSRFDLDSALSVLREFCRGLTPPSTVHANADYRREVAAVVAARALARATELADRR
jgi:carbon-monoxide dehydrogenase medium subunit